MKLFSRIRALIMLPLWLICLLVGPRAQSTPGVELVSQDLVVLGEAFTAGRGSPPTASIITPAEQ